MTECFAQSRNFYEHNMIKVRIIRSSQKKSKAVLLLWIFYVFVLSCVCYVFVRVCLYVLCGHLLGKGWPLGSRLWCLLWVCHFPIGILGQVWYLIVSIPDLCTLTFFESSARIDGYDYQNKDTPKKTLPLWRNKSVIFSVQCIIKTHVIPSCYFCHLGRHLGYFTTLKHNIMPVKFAECNYFRKLSEKGLLTVILISSGILL